MQWSGFGMSSWLFQVASYKLENERADERERSPTKPYRSHAWPGDHGNWWDHNTDVIYIFSVQMFVCIAR